MRALGYFNLLGVLLLAALCAVQWQANRRLNLSVVDLEREREEQARKIQDQVRDLKGLAADLDDFRDRLGRANAEVKEKETKLAAAVGERDKAVAERAEAAAERDRAAAGRDAFKTALEQWEAAVAQRDAALKKAGEVVLALARERNEAIGKFNELAGKYNAVVKERDEARAKSPPGK